MPVAAKACRALTSIVVILGILVLLAGCASKKPELLTNDVKFSLVQATDPLLDVILVHPEVPGGILLHRLNG